MTINDIFLDIGHGIGNATLQCAFTVGCESRGIEIVPERCRVAEQFHDIIFEHLYNPDSNDAWKVSYIERTIEGFSYNLTLHYKNYFLLDNNSITKSGKLNYGKAA